MPLVYDQLRSLARRCLASRGPQHTLRATALVNEAYVRLVHSDLTFNDRVHFFAVAARLLRHILVDHARGLNRQKRGAGAEKLTLDEAVLVSPETPSEILDLDEGFLLTQPILPARAGRFGTPDPLRPGRIDALICASTLCAHL
jgi:RNA polymerase sigma factor (TIGR02999 family)